MRIALCAAVVLLSLPVALDAQRPYPDGSLWDTTSYGAVPQSVIDKLFQSGRFKGAVRYGNVNCEWAEHWTKALINSGELYTVKMAKGATHTYGGERFFDRNGTKRNWAVVLESLDEATMMTAIAHEAWHWGEDVPDPYADNTRYCLQEPPPEDDDDTEDSNSGGEGGGGGSDDDWTDDDNGSTGGEDEEEKEESSSCALGSASFRSKSIAVCNGQ